MALSSGSFKKGHKKYCVEGNTFQKGHKQFNTGRTWLKEKENISYRGIHAWVVRKLGQPTKCEHCGKDKLSGHKIDWANKNHKYLKIKEDYIRLCKKCHREYDRNFKSLKEWLKNIANISH